MDPYVQEHIDLVTAIRTNQPFNEAESVAKSTLTAIMGRMSAYSGPEVDLGSDDVLGPETGSCGAHPGPSPLFQAQIPVPGKSKEQKGAADQS